jgi:phosphoglucosamine mutase
VTSIYRCGGGDDPPLGEPSGAGLSDAELDAVLAAADDELLEHVRKHARLESGLLAMMTAGSPEQPIVTAEPPFTVPPAQSARPARLFGTDGIRGVVGHDLTTHLATELGVAAAAVLGAGPGRRGHPVAVIGLDPRASGQFLEDALIAGLASVGVDVLRLGVMPTPGVAYLTAALEADFGIMISGGHNHARDNGMKFFGPGGVKLATAAEDLMTAQLRERQLGKRSGPAGLGWVSDASAEQPRYIDHLLSTLAGDPLPALEGLRVVVDCAHGAAYRLAPEVLSRAGAAVITIGAQPDGTNINASCGTTSLDALAAAVVRHGADAGVAYDGDADRCLAVDAAGQPLDGDQILAILATELKSQGKLARNVVVTTVMANVGFHVAMKEAGIAVVETPVGDKYVSAAMRKGGYVLGGEQSGHIILREHSTTGDGILTSLHLLAAIRRQGVTMAAAAATMRRYPQVLVSVPGDASRIEPQVAAAVSWAKSQLGESGRVLVRSSGTEPTIRLMVQASEPKPAERVIGQLRDEVLLALAGDRE